MDASPAMASARRAVVTPAVIGRDAEIAAVEAFLDRASGEPVGLTLSGEPGIGKTEIWAEAIRRARGRGYRVLGARPAERERQLAFARRHRGGDRRGSDVSASLPDPQRDALITDIIAGTADSASIVHTVFRADGGFAGTELLIRADLWAGQPCPTDVWLPVPPWLPEPTYFACHHFEFSAMP